MESNELLRLLESVQDTPVSHVDLSANAKRIKVDMDTRKITGHTEFGVIRDHLAENIIFEVKRYKGDTDLAEKHCAIHWENGENGGVLPVTEVDVSEDGHILMRWELSDEFTQFAGDIVYALHFFSILDGGFTYHAATNAEHGKLGTTLNASAHSRNKITPSEIEVYIAKMNALSAEIDQKIDSLEMTDEQAQKAVNNYLSKNPVKDGADGKSAYEFAKDGGYTGTEAEFAEKLAMEVPSKEEFSRLSSEKVDKTGITLDKDADGLIYIFIDGKPVGNGVEVTGEIVEGDIIGTFDENNNILLSGDIAVGTYTLAFVSEDGTYTGAGSLVVGEVEPEPEEPDTPKGNLADPTSADWLTDKRLATGYGYAKDLSGCIFTNYIPAQRGDVLRVKGLGLKTVVGTTNATIGMYSSTDITADSTGKLNAYLGFVATSINSESSSEGVRENVSNDGDIYSYVLGSQGDGQYDTYSFAYIRISAPLADGYTSEDVIITVNEEIPNYTNLFDASKATINKRTNSSLAIVDADGYVITGWIDVEEYVPFDASTKIYIKGAGFTSGGDTHIRTYIEQGTSYSNNYSQITGSTATITDEGNGVISVTNMASTFSSSVVRMYLCLKVKDTVITEADLQNIVITIDEPIA